MFGSTKRVTVDRSVRAIRFAPALGLLLLAMFAALHLASPPAALAQQDAAEVLVLEAEGPVTPAMLSYLERGVSAGEEQSVPVLVVLNTPGGSVDITQQIIRLFR